VLHLDVDLSSRDLSAFSEDVPRMFMIVPNVLDVDLFSLFIVEEPSYIV
jgi:hypothetical protein